MSDHREFHPAIEPTHNGLSIDLKLSKCDLGDGAAPSSDRASEASDRPSTPRTSEEIAEVLCDFIGHRSFRQVSKDTGFNPESVRRYLRGQGRIPADFVGTVCSVYSIDPLTVLIKDAKGPYRADPQPSPEDRLAEALGEWLRPQMTRWMRENIVPHGLFLRPLSAESASQDRDSDKAES